MKFASALQRISPQRRRIVQSHITRGDLACGGRFVELHCGHVVVVGTARAKAAECLHCHQALAADLVLEIHMRSARPRTA